jgi:catechol 2,3-dioxygenase-like lactoylglutathione lyase family enzyme
MEPIATLGCDHVDLSVTDLPRSIAFYETILGALGFRRVPHEEYVAWASATMMIGLRATTAPGAFDRYRVGLHHLALRAAKRADVDRFHAFLVERAVTVLDPPREYPEYGAGYYAVFFADPDGMKLELVHMPWGYWKRAMTDGTDGRARM